MTHRFSFGMALLSISWLLLINRSAVQANTFIASATDCDGAVTSVENKLRSGRSLIIKVSEKEPSRSFLGTPPAERPETYSFGISGKSVNNVMFSPVFLNGLATEIVNNCYTIGAVSFAEYQSDWALFFGIKGGSKVEPFTCPFENYDPYDPPASVRDLVWGEFCG